MHPKGNSGGGSCRCEGTEQLLQYTGITVSYGIFSSENSYP